MMLAQALHMVAGRTNQVVWRPEGEVLILTRQLGVKSLRSGKPTQYIPTFGALVADNWDVMPLEKFVELMNQQAAQEA